MQGVLLRQEMPEGGIEPQALQAMITWLALWSWMHRDNIYWTALAYGTSNSFNQLHTHNLVVLPPLPGLRFLSWSFGAAGTLLLC